MAGCSTLNGISKTLCVGSQSGIKNPFYIIEKAALSSFSVASGEITGATWNTGYSGATYYGLKDNCFFNEPHVGDGVLSDVYFQPTFQVVFKRNSVTVRNEIMSLSGLDLIIFYRDNNDIYWALGTDAGMNIIPSPGSQTGTKKGELNGNTLIFQGNETYKAYTCSASVIAGIPGI